MRTKLVLSSIALLVLSACEEKSDLCYQPGGACASDAQPLDAAVMCMGPADCVTTPTTPFCDLMTQTCVGCSESQQCVDLAGTADICLKEGGAVFGECVLCDEDGRQATDVGMAGDECQTAGSQVCDAATHECRGCLADDECTSGFCDGRACPAVADVAHVAMNGPATTDCTRAMPCATVAQALATAKPFIRVAAGTYSAGSNDIDINNQDVTIHATGATFTRTGSGAVLTVAGSSQVVIVGGTFDGMGNDDTVVSCSSNTRLTMREVTVRNGGTNGVTAACALTVQRSTISANTFTGIAMNNSGRAFELTRSTLIRNGSGGLSLSAQSAVIMNNYFVKNGVASSLPALQISSLTPLGSRIEFNTIAGNVADSGSAAGAASCSTSAIVLRNSILYFNNGIAQVSVCTVRYSSVQGATPDAVNGVINDNPSFINTGGDNFGLMPASAVAGKADPATDLTGAAAIDFDGDARPNPAGGRADLGADEIP